MTNLLSRAFPPPSNWQDFERLCFDVFSRMWKTNDAQLHGRLGQPQAGVDVYGTDRVEQVFVGVQCKGKDQGYENPIEQAELREEIEKAKAFRPRLDVFVLATSAPNDATVQALARELTEAHRQEGLFEVRVEGWTTLRQRVSNFPEIVRKYFSDLAPVDVVSRFDDSMSLTQEEGAKTRTLLQQTHAATVAAIEKGDSTDRLQMRITEIAKFIEEGQPVASLKAFERLWSSEGARASPRNRYRIRANIGIACLVVGDTTRAIGELRAAAAEDPTWPAAKAIRATAELLDGNRDQAFALAKEVLAEDSSVQQAATVLIESASGAVTIPELLVQIPPVHLEKLDVLLTLGQRARRAGNAPARHDFLAHALSIAPNDWRVLEAQAELLLEPIFAQDGMAITHAVPASLELEFESAIGLLQQSWDQLMKRDDARVGVHVAANLLTALEIAGRRNEYEQLLTKALEVAPTFPPFLRRYAQAMAALDDWSAARNALDRIPAGDSELPDRLLKLQAEIHSGAADKAAVEARALETELGAGREAEIAAALQVEAARATGSLGAILPDILARWPRSIVLRSVVHNSLPESDPRRENLIDEIRRLADSINDPADRMHAAEALYAAKQFSAAADMYEGLHGLDKDTLPLTRHLKSLYFADRRREARALFDQLVPELQANPRYAEIGVAIYESAGLLKDARAILEKVLEQDDSLHRRVYWLNLSERLGDEAGIVTWLNSVGSDQKGTPQDLMTTALAIDRHHADPRCFPIAYRALRTGYHDPQIHLSYMIGLVFTGHARERAFSTPQAVGPDTAVLLEEREGPRKLVRILETEQNPNVERDEIGPDNVLWPALLGHKIGDDIEFASAGVTPNVFVVREIRNKYLHAHFRSLEQFETLFPGHQAFSSFHIDESKGDEKFKPLLESVKRRAEFGTKLLDLYRRNNVPIMLVSRWSGASPCESWEFLRAQPDLGMRVCFGTPQEFALASAAMAANQSVVIDAVTLYALTRLGIADRVKTCFADVGVVQTAVDTLRRLVAEWEQDRGKKHGKFGWDGEYYRLVEFDEIYDDAKIGQARAALSFAESLTLLPAEPIAGLTPKQLEVFDGVDPSFLDTVYAAQGNNRLVFSDDLIFRQLAIELSGMPGVWTQQAALSAGQVGKITPDDYYDIAGALASADYRFTQIDNRLILRMLDKTAWAITEDVEVLGSQIALPSNEQPSVVRLLADLAQFGWGQKPDTASYVDLFAAQFRAIRRLQPQNNLRELFAAIVVILRARFRSNGYQVYLKTNLRSSTIYTSSQSIIDTLNIAADEALKPVAASLLRALQIAEA